MNINSLKKTLLNVIIFLLMLTSSTSLINAQETKAEWMSGAWGIGFRFKADNKSHMNSWDADILAEQIHQIPGVNYVLFNLSDAAHGDAYIAPHSVLSMINPSSTPTSPDDNPMNGRDLFKDMALAFKARGIKVIAYCATQGPAMLKHGAKNAYDSVRESDGTYTSEAMNNWAKYVTKRYGDTSDAIYKQAYAEVIIDEYAARYGTLIDGWWFDHSRFANIPLLSQIVKSHNTDAVVAFNNGQKIPLINNNAGYEDYTFGHPTPISRQHSSNIVNHPMLTSIESTVDGYFETEGRLSLGHMFMPIQETWNAGDLVWTQEQGSDWLGRCLKARGAWTWNVDVTDSKSILRKDTVELMNAIFDGILTSNGTPYSWLARHGLVINNDYEAADKLDSDNDGQTNHDEYKSGTDPNDKKSLFAISSITKNQGSFQIKWNSVNDRHYTVLISSTLKEGDWTAIASDIQGSATSTSYNYKTSSDSNMFFKVVAKTIQ